MPQYRKQIRIGLTGGIGAGKTFVGAIFSKFDIPVFNADSEAKISMSEVGSLQDEIQKLFGSKAYKDGVLQNNFIADIVFNNSKILDKLNKLVHPVVKKSFEDWCVNQNSDIVIKEAAILFESNSHVDLDKVICVSAPENTRVDRVVRRDSCSRIQVLSRMARQLSQSEKESHSDFIIVNDGLELIVPQIIKIISTLD